MKKRIFIPSVLCSIAVISGGCVTDNSTHTTNNTRIEIPKGSDKASTAKYSGTFDIEAILKVMGDREFATGYTDASGVWIISKVSVPIKKDRNSTQAAEIAAIRAQKNIAGFLGTAVSAESEHSYEKVVVNGKTDIKKHFKRITKTKIEQFLRGTTQYKSSVSENVYSAIFYTTGKMVDRTAELEAQLKAAPPGVVRAVGFGVIADGKVSPAKRQAMQSALRNAVEQVMGTTVIGQSQLMDNEKAKSKVIAQTVGNVKEYRVVKEDKDGVNYQIIINARVDEKNLLNNYAAMVRSMGNPGFMVKCQDPDLKAAFSGFLAELGFKVVNRESDAAFIVDGNCKYLAANHDYYGKGIQIDLNLRLIDKKSGQEFFNISNEPRFTTSFSGSLHQIRQSSARKAFNKMREELHERLNKVVMDWVLNGREVTVTFKNAANTALDEVLAQSVADVPCAKFQTRSRNGKTLVLHCSYVGPSADFEEFLRERMKKDLPQGTHVPVSQKIELNSLEFSF